MGQKNVVIDWELPTFEEQMIAIAPAVAEAAEWQARCELYQEIYQLSARIEAALETKRQHIRDREGRLITHFDEWLLAAEAGRWP